MGLRPMSTAPRDGTKIRVRRKPRPNTKHHVVTVAWRQTGSGWPPAVGYWAIREVAGGYAHDHNLLGWWPVGEEEPTDG